MIERLNELTRGKGPEKCIDCVGLEAHVSMKHPDSILDRAKTALDAYCAMALSSGGRRQLQARPMRDYSDRSGLPRPPEQVRGAARDFMTPPDMRSELPSPPRRPAQAASMGRA